MTFVLILYFDWLQGPHIGGPPRGFGDSGRRAIYFQGFGEKGHLFSGIWGEIGVLGSREQGPEEKHFRKLGRKAIFLSGSREERPPGEASYRAKFRKTFKNLLLRNCQGD